MRGLTQNNYVPFATSGAMIHYFFDELSILENFYNISTLHMQNFIIQGTCTYTGVHGLTSDMTRDATNLQYIYTKSMAELPVDAWKEFFH